MWRDRKWRKLLNLIHHLPSWSLFNEARANDEELAEMLAGVEMSEREERISDWNPETGLLAAIYDRMGDLINAVIIMQGGKKIDTQPLKRPVTAIQRARVARAHELSKAFRFRMTNRDREGNDGWPEHHTK